MSSRTGPAFTGTIVVPVRDGRDGIERCLDALCRARPEGWAIVVVDDNSRDGSAARARRPGVTVVEQRPGRGPSAARNTGARLSEGEWLCFVDADCVVHEDAFTRARAVLDTHPETDALFGSYDDSPADPGLVSQFKNLYHHYVHHHSGPEAVTFWAGLGLVRRMVFERADGFDAERYPQPSVEDIDLGYRMTLQGARIRVAPTVQCTHLKAWSLPGVVRSDLWDRGVPWVRLLRRHRVATADLNLRYANRLSVAALYAGALGLLTTRGRTRALVAAGTAAVLLVLNQRLYRFFLRARGPAFTVAAIGLHWAHYAVNGLAVVLALASGRRRRG